MAKKIIPGKKPIQEGNNPKDISLNEQISEPCEYEVKKDDRFRVKFKVILKERRWIIVDDKYPGAEEHWVEFKMWSFNEETEIRKNSTQYDTFKRIHFIDHDLLTRLKISKLLKDWSFAEKNERLKLYHMNGILVDEGWNNFTRLQPNILRYIIDKMNEVLEHNE